MIMKELEMRQWVSALLLLTVVLGLTGCGSMQKKFTRKKKVEKHVPAVIYVEQGPYQKKFSNDYYYRTHYTLWRTWHDELIDGIGGNSKKMNRSGEETISHLEQMKNYLKPERRSEIEGHIRDLKSAVTKVESGLNDSQQGTAKVELERIRRLISHDFYYDKIQKDLVADAVDLGVSTP